MNKKLFLLTAMSLLLSINLCSAYYYGGYYDSYNYHSSRSYGNYYGTSYSRTIDYDRTTQTRYLPYGGYETTTTYQKTVREEPRYGYYYRPYYKTYYYPMNTYHYRW